MRVRTGSHNVYNKSYKMLTEPKSETKLDVK